MAKYLQFLFFKLNLMLDDFSYPMSVLQNIFNFLLSFWTFIFYFYDIWLWGERKLYVWCHKKNKTLNKSSFRDIFIYANHSFFHFFFLNKNNLFNK